MNLPEAPREYDAGDEQTNRQTLMREMRRTRKQGQNIDLGLERLTLRSPDGSRWALTVTNAGALVAVAVP